MDIITAINFPFHAVLGVSLSFGPSANKAGKKTVNEEMW